MANMDDRLNAALTEATANFIKANPASRVYFDRASEHLPGGNTRTTLFSPPFPLAVLIASGTRVRSADGDVYLDMVCEYTAGIFGHSHPEILEALENALSSGLNFGATCPLEGELAGRLKRRFQAAGLEMLRFTNSGTEANIIATSLARCRGRSKIMVFEGSYHGSVLSFPSKKADPMRMPGEYVVVEYNSIDAVRQALSDIPPESLAAILVEPMQGAGGCRPASRAFLQFLRETADGTGALLIHDEVMTSRLHYQGGLSGKYQIKPDLVTMGKYLAGGMSCGIVGGRKDLLKQFNPHPGANTDIPDSGEVPMHLAHSGTFNNNVMTLNAGIAASKILTPEVLQKLNELGDYLRTSIATLLVELKIINVAESEDAMDDIATTPRGNMWISGLGSLNAIHFGENDESETLRDLFYFHMIENHIYVTRRGFVVLSIQHEKEDVDRYISCVKSFIERYSYAIVSGR